MQIRKDVNVGGKNWKESALEHIPEGLKHVVAGKSTQFCSEILRRRIKKKKSKK